MIFREFVPGVSGGVTSCPRCRRLMVTFADPGGFVDCDPAAAMAFGILSALEDEVLALVDHQAFVLAREAGPHACPEAFEKWHAPAADPGLTA